MANRLFDLKETKGTFEVKGIVTGTVSNKFYTSKKTKTGKDFRAVYFGCEYDHHKSIYVNLNGMPQKNVYFSKRVSTNGTTITETKPVDWENRYKFDEEGFRLIGVNVGLVKTKDNNGNDVNDKRVLHAFDACDYINANLKDNTSVYVKGSLDFSSYMDSQQNIRKSIKYTPNQVSLCKDVDFDNYDDDKNKEVHNFTQTIVYTGIEKEKENGRETGRALVSAKIVTYSDIVDTQFVIKDDKLARLFNKNLKPYWAIEVSGRIEVSHSIEKVNEDDFWGEQNAMENVSAPTKIELIITGAKPSTIEKEAYTEANIAEAIQKIRSAQTAEQNFTGKSTASTDTGNWGEDLNTDDDDEPW